MSPLTGPAGGKFSIGRRTAFGWAAAVLLLSASAFAAQAPIADPGNSGNEYRIGPGNVIQIKILGEASTHQIYRVDESGYIKHALIDRVKVADLTVAEAEHLMERKLAGDYIIDPHVTIYVLEFSRFSIMGEITRPGTYEITGRVSIIEAISMAGGFTRVANARDVRIMRKSQGQENVINVDTTRITSHGDLSAQVDIQADDVIVVSKSFF